MTSYFPLLPNINLDNNEKVIGSLTFLNFPNNFLKKNISAIKTDSIFIGSYKLLDKSWILLNIKECSFKSFKTINREKLSVSDTIMVVCVIRKDKEFPQKCSILPSCHSLRVDQSVVEERASFNYTYRNSTTSYQGEYPTSMANIKKGSFISFDILKTYKRSDDIENFVLFMNLNVSAKLESKVSIKLFDSLSRSELYKFNAKQNSICIFNLEILNDKDFKKTLFYSSKTSSFIPLILSLDKNKEQLSFEHTHPPTDIFIGSDKFKLVKLLKEEWLK
tara:strand:+ start:1383 stop:2213 length:831 start_codon:yes stop_codon:yes gene_type:complete